MREEAAFGDTAKLPGGVATDISDLTGDGRSIANGLDGPTALYGMFQRRNLCGVNECTKAPYIISAHWAYMVFPSGCCELKGPSFKDLPELILGVSPTPFLEAILAYRRSLFGFTSCPLYLMIVDLPRAALVCSMSHICSFFEAGILFFHPQELNWYLYCAWLQHLLALIETHLTEPGTHFASKPYCSFIVVTILDNLSFSSKK